MKKINKLKHINVNCPVFKCSLHFVFNCGYKDLRDFCIKEFDMDKADDMEWLAKADGTAMVLEDKSGMDRVIWIEKFAMNHSRLGVLVHEITHATVRILEHKGIPFSSHQNQDETFAYLMDYFVSNFIYLYKNIDK